MATSSETDRPEARIVSLRDGDVAGVDQLVVDGRDRVLPQQLLGRNLRSEVAGDRPHVAVRQLEPGPRERVGELLRVLVEPSRDRPVDRVHAQREVGRQHHRGRCARRVVGEWDGALAAGSVGTHWYAPAGLLVRSQSYLKSVSK